jgi:hypothetical protein
MVRTRGSGTSQDTEWLERCNLPRNVEPRDRRVVLNRRIVIVFGSEARALQAGRDGAQYARRAVRRVCDFLEQATRWYSRVADHAALVLERHRPLGRFDRRCDG